MFSTPARRILRVGSVWALVCVLATPVAAAPRFLRSGTIASGAQFDLFSISLPAGTGVTATLVCDFDGVSRPLDPVLSVFFPGVDPSDTNNASISNDESFGTDDSVHGIDCDAFDSAQVQFAAPVSGIYIFRADGLGSATGPYTLTINSRAVVTGSGTGSHVVVFAGVGPVPNWTSHSIQAYGPSFNGGVRVASRDVNGDGTPDVLAAAGPGGAPEVRVFDGQFGAELRTFTLNNTGFAGGLSVAAGDVNGDGRDDIIMALGAGGVPLVHVIDAVTGAELHDIFAYGGAFRGGVFVAAGDLNGDGRDDIITAPGPGGGPNVKVFDGKTGAMIRSFFAYGPGFTGGVFVGSGDVDGDGRDDIITAPGAGGGPNVKVFSGINLAVIRNFLAFDPAFMGGVRVAAADVNGDGRADIITGGLGLEIFVGGRAQVRVFSGAPELTMLHAWEPYSFYFDGIFVAAR